MCCASSVSEKGASAWAAANTTRPVATASAYVGATTQHGMQQPWTGAPGLQLAGPWASHRGRV